MDDDELRRLLAEVGERRAQARAARTAASSELAPLVQAAAARDIPLAEIARIAQLSRPTVYEFLGERPGPRSHARGRERP